MSPVHSAVAMAGVLGLSLPLRGVAAEAGQGPVTAIDPLGAGYLLQFSLGLLAVLAAVVGLAWLLKRVGGLQGGAAGTVKALGGISLGPRERVVLIQVGEEQLLIGVAPGQVRTLHVLDHPIAPAQTGRGAPVNGSFAQRLAGVLSRPGPAPGSQP